MNMPTPPPGWGPTQGMPAMRPQVGRPLRPAGLGGSVPTRPGTPPGMRSGAGVGQPMRPQPWEQSLRAPHNSPNISQSGVHERLSGGVRPGSNMMGGPSVGAPQGPSLQQIQAEMARRQVGAQLGPRNGALAGYMMS